MKRIFLPFIRRPKPTVPVLKHPIGVDDEGGFPELIVANRHYKIQIRWTAFEPTPDTYMLEPNVVEILREIGTAERYISFKTCPPKYRLWTDYQGSPPRPEFIPKMCQAIVQAVRLTGATAVELLNEPNVRYTDVSAKTQWHFGAVCGPDPEPWFEGGVRYGEMLREVVVYLSRYLPGVKVFAGALLCDSFSKPIGNNIEFLKGAMSVNRGRLPGAAVTVHPYIVSSSFARDEGLAVAFTWVMDYVKKIQDLTLKPVIFSETSILLPDNILEDDLFRERQAAWVRFLKLQLSEQKIAGFTWYNWASEWSWNHCALIRGAQRGSKTLLPTPAYGEWRKA